MGADHAGSVDAIACGPFHDFRSPRLPLPDLRLVGSAAPAQGASCLGVHERAASFDAFHVDKIRAIAHFVYSHSRSARMARRPQTSPRKMASQRRSRSTVDALVEATARVLIKEGYDRASTNKIAAKAGVSIGSLYQYFPSKEALVAAVIERHTQALSQAVSNALLKVAATPDRDRGARTRRSRDRRSPRRSEASSRSVRGGSPHRAARKYRSCRAVAPAAFFEAISRPTVARSMLPISTSRLSSW